MDVREGLLYSPTHQWAAIDGDAAEVGVTDYAQSALGGLVFVNLPEVGDELVAGEPFAEAESVKVVSDVHAPVSGTVVEVNEELFDEPGLVNDAPYDAWLVRVEGAVPADDLMDAAAYRALLDRSDA